MKLQFLLIWLILARTLLGACCGPDGLRGNENEAGCCRSCCGQEPERCELSVDTAACFLCAACDGRVPTIPPTGLTPSFAGDWFAVLARPFGIEPAMVPESISTYGIRASQVPHGVAWIERLRPIVCIWTI